MKPKTPCCDDTRENPLSPGEVCPCENDSESEADVPSQKVCSHKHLDPDGNCWQCGQKVGEAIPEKEWF